MKVVITRPQADAEMMATQLRGIGVLPIVAPLMSVDSVESELPSLDAYQAVIVTSANGVRALSQRTEERDIRLFAVGVTTAALARKLGFKQVEEAGGDVTSLAGLVRRHADSGNGPLLHVAGSVVAGDLSGDLSHSGFRVDRIVLYNAVASKQIPASLAEVLMSKERAMIVFFSPRTARIFIELARDADLLEECSGNIAVCLSDAVAETLKPYFKRLKIANGRSANAMIDLIRDEICAS